MVTIQKFRKLALSFPETTEEPHFEKISFRVNKKIFATYDAVKNVACVKLSEIDQSVFSKTDKHIYAVPNKWGIQGWTILEMKMVNANLFADALQTAYWHVAPNKLREQITKKNNSGPLEQ